MYLGLARHCIAFEHFLDEINASARPVQFIAQQLIGGARGGAETAMHAGAQNALGLLAVRGIFYGISELGLHYFRLVLVLFDYFFFGTRRRIPLLHGGQCLHGLHIRGGHIIKLHIIGDKSRCYRGVHRIRNRKLSE